MADLLPFPPPVTGERPHAPWWPVDDDYWRRRHDALLPVLRQVERDRDIAEDQRDGLLSDIARGRYRGPSRYGLYAACMAGGVFVGWLLGGLGL